MFTEYDKQFAKITFYCFKNEKNHFFYNFYTEFLDVPLTSSDRNKRYFDVSHYGIKRNSPEANNNLYYCNILFGK